MSIRFIADAFRKCVEGRASCSAAIMKYDRDDAGKEYQILTFYVQPVNGAYSAFSHKIPGSADPVQGATDAAKLYLQTL